MTARDPWEPDPEAELEFARRAGYSQRHVERMRREQERNGKPHWPDFVRGPAIVLITQPVFHAAKPRAGVLVAILLAVAASALVVVGEVAIRLLLRTYQRHQSRRRGHRGRRWCRRTDGLHERDAAHGETQHD